MPQRMTAQTLRVLEVLLSNPAREWYGLEIIELAGLSSGTVYPILHRLHADGWLSSAREDIDPSREGRPRRRLYQLTGSGESAATTEIAKRIARTERTALSRPLHHPKGATA